MVVRAWVDPAYKQRMLADSDSDRTRSHHDMGGQPPRRWNTLGEALSTASMARSAAPWVVRPWVGDGGRR
jgi:hypothetical protein